MVIPWGTYWRIRTAELKFVIWWSHQCWCRLPAGESRAGYRTSVVILLWTKTCLWHQVSVSFRLLSSVKPVWLLVLEKHLLIEIFDLLKEENISGSAVISNADYWSDYFQSVFIIGFFFCITAGITANSHSYSIWQQSKHKHSPFIQYIRLTQSLN